MLCKKYVKGDKINGIICYVNKCSTEKYKRFCLNNNYYEYVGLFYKDIDISCENGTVEIKDYDD